MNDWDWLLFVLAISPFIFICGGLLITALVLSLGG